MTMLGNTAISTVSLRMSSAHMPREILRTVEPAKLLACQSVENRWTRAKPSRVTSAHHLERQRNELAERDEPHRDGEEAEPDHHQKRKERRVPRRRIARRALADRIDQRAREIGRRDVAERREHERRHDDGDPDRLLGPVTGDEAEDGADRASLQY